MPNDSSSPDLVPKQPAQDCLTASDDPFEGGMLEMKDRIVAAVETIEKLYERRGALTGLLTGFKNFDRLTDGLHPGQMIVFASRPSMGRKTLALNIAEHVSIMGRHPVAIFSQALTSQEIVHRLLCSRARVNPGRVRDGFLSEHDFPKLMVAASRLAESKIYIDGTGRLSIEALRTKAIHLKQVHDIQLVVIDSLPLLRSTDRRTRESRKEEAARICFEVKALVKELKISIIALAQLNRRPEERRGGMPHLGDLREASSIEQHADLVGLLVRPEYYAEDEDARERLSGVAELIIAKQRNGPVGQVRLKFSKEFACFEDWTDDIA